jgi:hypothetical protein
MYNRQCPARRIYKHMYVYTYHTHTHTHTRTHTHTHTHDIHLANTIDRLPRVEQRRIIVSFRDIHLSVFIQRRHSRQR